MRAPRVCHHVRPPAERAPSPVGRFRFRGRKFNPETVGGSSPARYLGSGLRWTELLCVNPGVARDPGGLPAGIYVFVPGNARTRAAAPRTSMALQKGRHYLVARLRASRRRSILAATRRREPRNHTIHQAKDRPKTQTPRKQGPHRHKARQDHYALTV